LQVFWNYKKNVHTFLPTFFLAIVLSVFPRFTISDNFFGSFKLFSSTKVFKETCCIVVFAFVLFLFIFFFCCLFFSQQKGKLQNCFLLYGHLRNFLFWILLKVFSFLCSVISIVCLFVLFLLAIVLSILRFTDSDYPFWYLQTLLGHVSLCDYSWNPRYK